MTQIVLDIKDASLVPSLNQILGAKVTRNRYLSRS